MGSSAGVLARAFVFLFGMALFVVGWWWVAAKQGIDFSFVLWIIAGMALIVVATLLWIQWNLRIHKVKGPRRGVRDPGPLPANDQLGRHVVLRSGVDTAARTVLTLEGNEIIISRVEAP